MIIETVKRTIEKHNLIEEGDRIVVGVSGGPDSVCLLYLLHQLTESRDISLTAVHVNHCLRGDEADRDQEFTEQLCKRLGIPCRVFSCDIIKMAKEEKMTVEEAGREFRYRCFHAAKQEILATEGKERSVKIAVAQNRNDQAETVLMRILRGTGTDGLAGMEYKREDGIIRPLLDVGRDAIEEYCLEEELEPRTDLTNLDSLYTRNRIRLELIPGLQREYNQEIIAAITRLSRIAAEDKEFIYQNVDAILQITGALSTGRFPRGRYNELHPAVGKRIVAKLFKEAGLLQDMTALHLARADLLIRDGKSGDLMEFPKGYTLEILTEEAVFRSSKRTSQRTEERGFCHQVILDGRTEIPLLGTALVTRILSASSTTGCDRENPFKICIPWDDKKASLAELLVRTRRPGDRFSPLGMKGSKKLQDFFVDEKIPREDRENIPLLCLGSEVLWVIGRRIGEECRMDQSLKTMLYIEYIESV